ncbi:beta-galactosidase GalB [Flavobacterium sp.]|uniref:beta-galactosidase GalB n=1 Tax=Flavobacterium sp. TaxID=239 RepID=UPI00286DD74C|nr:beta-galactosidase GalB [Flavobacterium sp.]
MKKHLLIATLICFAFQIMAQEKTKTREVQLLDTGWRFLNKEIPTTNLSQVDDSSWQTVTIPHDWAIAGPFDMTIDMQKVTVIEDGDRGAKLRTGRTGALPCFGIGWYRKALAISKEDEGKRIFVEFDGAMSRSKVYLNGVYVGEWPYGYSSFSFELTKFIQFGKENILSIRLENKEESSRWYSGAGIYRNVRLVKTAPVRVAHWGTYITTPVITDKQGQVAIKTDIDGNEAIQLVTEIYDAKGKEVASAVANKKADGSTTVEQLIKVNKPSLWSVETPILYTAVSKVFVGKTQKDEYKTTFGFRTIRFDKDKGFFLNGKYTKFKGVCLHHDLGSIGAAVSHRATERQLVMMKEMGVNAIRTSHNPPSLELLKICDSIGLMVQVEAFDEWKNGKNTNGYGEFFDEWAEKDLTAMIKRDRNHPSVVMWSIGNEIREQGMPEGAAMAKFLTKISHDLDPTRPVSAGFNNWKGAIKNGLAAEVDLVGFNYAPDFYDKMRKENPTFTIYGSETASTVSSRGEYKFPVVASKKAWYTDYQLTSYDLETCSWADLPDFEFQYQDDLEFVAGEFVWTGFDYLGEPSPYNEGTPARSSYFGIVDLAGIPKDRYYLYQSKWSDKPVLHVLPHWTWPDRLNQKVPVFCYTNYPKAELFVNGKSMGTRVKDKSSMLKRYRLMWDDVIYEPGEIKVLAYDANDKVVAEQIIKTAGETYTIKLTADRNTIKADGKDLSFVTVELLDKNGNLCPRANNLLFFDVTGAGKLKAICNGDATDQTAFVSKYMRTFNGKMVAVIESETKAGEIVLKVSGGLLKAQEVKISTNNP